jgi:hypothetical protein
MDASRHSDPPKIYIYHVDHEHDRTYTENLVEYLTDQGVLWRSMPLSFNGTGLELQLCLDDRPTAVLGFNSQLDHAWIGSCSFLEMAERHDVPVIQWILDHPSSRWPEFGASTAANSRFLLNSEHERQYFETYCLPGALTATTGGVGPNRRSRIGSLTEQGFLLRPIACMIPLMLRRLRSIDESDDAIRSLEPPLADVARDAVAEAQCNLIDSLQLQVSAALARRRQNVPPRTFNALCRIVGDLVQTFRRSRIFAAASRYPVLIQSDESVARFVRGSAASLQTNVGMQLTLARMPFCRAVLSVSPVANMIHDRTMNALNAGCVAIAEDNLASKGLLRHKENALLFRYNDDSLEECLDIVCNQPERAYEIACAGMQLRDDPRFRFGQFQNVIDLARRRM